MQPASRPEPAAIPPAVAYPRAAWYPTVAAAALDAAAAAETAVGFTLLGQRLVLWRDAEGFPAVLADRCAHEGARLSNGFCKAEGLICRFHGWSHDRHGNAAHPRQRYLKRPAGSWGTVPAFHALEHLGRIWVALEEPQAPPPGADQLTAAFRHQADRLCEVPAAVALADARDRLTAAEITPLAPHVFDAAMPGGRLLVTVTSIDEQRAQLCGFAATDDEVALVGLSDQLDRMLAG